MNPEAELLACWELANKLIGALGIDAPFHVGTSELLERVYEHILDNGYEKQRRSH